MDTQDTIAAIATAPGEAGIAAIRVSGPEALAIADRVFRCSGSAPSQREGGTFVYGHVKADRPGPAGDATDLDEAILLIYRAPRSYTRENTVELQCHGGSIAAKRVLRALIDHGARAAEPGEFTRRAFLNGRLDLVQAEAVLDLIRARSDRAASAAIQQLNGSISILFHSLYDVVISCASDLEAVLDFSVEELPDAVYPDIAARLRQAEASMDELLSTWDEGRFLREGALVAITGEPNVGKSTLLNALLQTRRAIVAETPGTTRDTIEETLILDGIPLRLVDTAGIRATDCHIEREGVDRARNVLNSADFTILMIDASVAPSAETRARIDALGSRHTILLLNKTDLGMHPEVRTLADREDAIPCSLRDGAAPRALLDRLRQLTVQDIGATPRATIGERHRSVLQDTRASIQEAIEVLLARDEGQLVLAASTIRDALERLGMATGRVYHAELLDAVFSRFCIGK